MKIITWLDFFILNILPYPYTSLTSLTKLYYYKENAIFRLKLYTIKMKFSTLTEWAKLIEIGRGKKIILHTLHSWKFIYVPFKCLFKFQWLALEASKAANGKACSLKTQPKLSKTILILTREVHKSKISKYPKQNKHVSSKKSQH